MTPIARCVVWTLVLSAPFWVILFAAAWFAAEAAR